MAHRFQNGFQKAQLRSGRTTALDPRWLSRLIDAMEEAARPELRAMPCDRAVISALSAHLARPSAGFAHYGSAFSLRN